MARQRVDKNSLEARKERIAMLERAIARCQVFQDSQDHPVVKLQKEALTRAIDSIKNSILDLARTVNLPEKQSDILICRGMLDAHEDQLADLQDPAKRIMVFERNIAVIKDEIRQSQSEGGLVETKDYVAP